MANVPTTRTTRKAPAKKAAQGARAKAAVKRSTRAVKRATNASTKAAATSKPTTRKPRATAKKPATRKPTTRKRSTRKAVSAIRGGGAALPDFGNADRITVIAKKRAEISRADCFKSGDTVSRCLLKQKEAGFRGRRKYIRTQKAAGRISLRKA